MSLLLDEMEVENLSAANKKKAAEAKKSIPENHDPEKYGYDTEKNEWVLKPGLIDGLKDAPETFSNTTQAPLSEFGDLFSRAKESNAAMEEVTGKYLSFESWTKDEERIMVFTGMTTFKTEKDEIIPAAKLVDEQGTRFICASAVLTGSLANVAAPKAVKIKNLGKPAGKNYYDLKVFVAS